MQNTFTNRWAIFFSVFLFYFLLLIGISILDLSYEYQNIYQVSTNTHPVIYSIYLTAFNWRWIIYLIISLSISPWIVAKTFNLEFFKPKINQENNHQSSLDFNGKEINKIFLLIYGIIVVFIVPLWAYLWQIFIFEWINGFHISLDLDIFSIELWDYLPLIMLMLLSSLTFIQIWLDLRKIDIELTTAAFTSLVLIASITPLILVFNLKSLFAWWLLGLSLSVLLFLFVACCSYYFFYKTFRTQAIFYGSELISVILSIAILSCFYHVQSSQIWLLSIISGLDIVVLISMLVYQAQKYTNSSKIYHKLIPNINQYFYQFENRAKIPRLRAAKIPSLTPTSSGKIFAVVAKRIILLFKPILNNLIIFILNFIIQNSLLIIKSIISFIVFLSTHFFYIVKILPLFIYRVIIIIINALEIVLKVIYFPLGLIFAAALSIVIATQLIIDYFLIADIYLLLGFTLALITYILSMVWCMALMFETSFLSAFNFYISQFSKLFSYLILCYGLFNWTLIAVDNWVLEVGHFQPGILTWSSSIFILFSMPIALLLPNKTKQNNKPTTKNIISSEKFSAKDKLYSSTGVDYTELQNLLAQGKWKEADYETYKVMLQAVGQESSVYLSNEDINNFPCEDLLIINKLWVDYSDGHFGFSVQKKIYQSLGETKDYNKEAWETFCDRVGWRKDGEWLYYDHLTFALNAPGGHLPVWCWVGWLFFVRAETCNL